MNRIDKKKLHIILFNILYKKLNILCFVYYFYNIINNKITRFVYTSTKLLLITLTIAILYITYYKIVIKTKKQCIICTDSLHCI